MKTIKDIILGRKDPGNLHAWAKTNEDHSIDLGIWYNGKWNFIGGSSEGGGGGAGGNYPSDEQIIHIVADADYDDDTTYFEPSVNDSPTPPTYEEVKTLLNKYKGQVFIDYTVYLHYADGDSTDELKFLLRFTFNDVNSSKYIIFMGQEGVSVKITSDNVIDCSHLRNYGGYFECTVINDDVSYFNCDSSKALDQVIENEHMVTCIIHDITNGDEHFTTLTANFTTQQNSHKYVFSNGQVKLTVEYSSEDDSLIGTTFEYIKLPEGGGGGVSEDQFVHFTVHDDESVTTDITQTELDNLIEKYNYMVYGIVTIDDVTIIMPLVQVIASTTEPIYIFSSPGYSSGFDVIVKYRNGESSVELHSLAQIINELIKG